MRKKVAKLAVAVAAAAGLGLTLSAALPLPAPQPGQSYTVPVALPSPTAPSQRKEVPSFTFADGNGAPRTISAYRGKVVLVNFWATWCPPCVKEMPSLSQLQLKMAGQPFEVLALSQDRGGADVVKSYYDQQKITNLKVYIDQGGKAGRALGLKGLPTSILIDAAGREVLRHAGALEWDDAAVVDAVRKVLEGY